MMDVRVYPPVYFGSIKTKKKQSSMRRAVVNAVQSKSRFLVTQQQRVIQPTMLSMKRSMGIDIFDNDLTDTQKQVRCIQSV